MCGWLVDVMIQSQVVHDMSSRYRFVFVLISLDVHWLSPLVVKRKCVPIVVVFHCMYMSWCRVVVCAHTVLLMSKMCLRRSVLNPMFRLFVSCFALRLYVLWVGRLRVCADAFVLYWMPCLASPQLTQLRFGVGCSHGGNYALKCLGAWVLYQVLGSMAYVCCSYSH